MSDQGQVDFYVLASADERANVRLACRLAEKAYRLGHRVHVRTASAAAAADLDELLWTFRQGSFVPHERTRPGEPPRSPVTIGAADEAAPATDVLINLADTLPEQAATFQRVAEIITATTESKALGRKRYAEYRNRGMKLLTHEIGEEP